MRVAGGVRWLAVLLLALPGMAWAQPDYSHLLRIQISVEFDGERVDFDELVFCGHRVKGTLTTRPVTQLLPSRHRVTRVLSDGSMLEIDGLLLPWGRVNAVSGTFYDARNRTVFFAAD